MKALLITAVGLMTLSFGAQAQSCEPQYQVQRESCDLSKMHQGLRKGKPDEESRRGDELAKAYCNDSDKEALAKQWNISPEDVDLTSAENSESRERYGVSIQTPLGRGFKRDIVCYYSATKCPISGAIDANQCFRSGSVSVSESSVVDKLKSTPGNQSEAWIKAQYLLDARKAVTDNGYSLSLDTIKRIDTALYLLSTNSKVGSSHLSEYIKTEAPSLR